MTRVHMGAASGLGLLLILGGCGQDGEEDHAADSGSDHEGGGHEEDLEGLRMCCHLGQICHESDHNDGSDADGCHDLGHELDPAACRESYARCLAACDPAGVSPEPPASCSDSLAGSGHGS